MTAAEELAYQRAVAIVLRAGEIIREQHRFLPRKSWLEKVLDFLARLWG